MNDKSKPIALVTGASRGIGAAIAEFLAKDHNLILCASHKNNLNKITDIIIAKYPDCKITQLGFNIGSQPDVAKNLGPVLKQYNKINILVNVAGILTHEDGIKQDTLEQILQVNLLGTYYLIDQVLPYMKQQRSGYIFNLSSRAGERAVKRLAAYSTSKYAVTGLSENLLEELLPFGIKVTALCPGVVNTDMGKAFTNIPDQDKIDPQDIVNAVKFCLSLSDNAVINKILIQCKKYILG